jgi:diguanylate cyclase
MNFVKNKANIQRQLVPPNHLLSDDLRVAIDRNQLDIVYQPQIEVLTGHVVGVEALMRWHHPTRGDIPPTEFIAIAEQTGLIHHLGEWMLDRAGVEARSWEGLSTINPTLSINFSPYQLESHNFLDNLNTILAKTQLKPTQLMVELTKINIGQDFTHLMAMLQQLQRQGISIALTNAALGNDVIDLLQSLPINVLKFDRDFVRQILLNPNAEMQFYTIVNLAKRLKIPFIAAGVETADQVEFLSWHGCRVLQGYWYRPPCGAIDLQHWLLQRG